MVKKKDPYLSELDALGELPEEEPTDVNFKSPVPEPRMKEDGVPLGSETLSVASDVPVQVVVVLGRKEISMKELVELRTGQIVELDKVPNEAVDLVVGGKIFAKGELVEIEGKLGIRILKMLK